MGGEGSAGRRGSLEFRSLQEENRKSGWPRGSFGGRRWQRGGEGDERMKEPKRENEKREGRRKRGSLAYYRSWVMGNYKIILGPLKDDIWGPLTCQIVTRLKAKVNEKTRPTRCT